MKNYKRYLFLAIVIGLALMVTNLSSQAQSVLTGTLTLVDENDDPLNNYPADYPAETRNLSYKYRCGGAWSAGISVQTDANGQFPYSISCADWDNKITVTLNQTSKEQVVTTNAVFQVARVDVNLKSCAGSIAATPGGTVEQGGGYWYTHGTTGPSGTVTFYAFPANIKVRMSYNHKSQEVNQAVESGSNNIDYQTTALTINHPEDIRSNLGGSWWLFSKPAMDLLPGNYPFWFKNGSVWEGPVTITVAGCEMTHPLVEDPPTGEITVTKQVNGDVALWSFGFTGDLGDFSLSDSAPSRTFEELETGDYLISENATAGYMTSVTCDNGQSGDHSVTVNLGEEESVICTFTNTLQWPFTGFFSPVDNLPIFNSVKAGSAVPMKFNIDGDHGLNIIALGYPRSVMITCVDGILSDQIEETVAPGSSTLQYDPLSDRYQYNWKTQKYWSGTCRQFQLLLVDGTMHMANFKFR